MKTAGIRRSQRRRSSLWSGSGSRVSGVSTEGLYHRVASCDSGVLRGQCEKAAFEGIAILGQ